MEKSTFWSIMKRQYKLYGARYDLVIYHRSVRIRHIVLHQISRENGEKR